MATNDGLGSLSFAALKDEAGKHNIRRNLSATNLRSALRLVRNGERVPPGWLVAGSSIPLSTKLSMRQASTGASSLASSVNGDPPTAGAQQQSQPVERRALAKLPTRPAAVPVQGGPRPESAKLVKPVVAKPGMGMARPPVKPVAASAKGPEPPKPATATVAVRPRLIGKGQPKSAPVVPTTSQPQQATPASDVAAVLGALTPAQTKRVSAIVRQLSANPALIDLVEQAIASSEAAPPVPSEAAARSLHDVSLDEPISKTSTPKVPRAGEDVRESPMPDATFVSVLPVVEQSTSRAVLTSPSVDERTDAQTPAGVSRIRRLSDIEEEIATGSNERQRKRARPDVTPSPQRRTQVLDEALDSPSATRRSSSPGKGSSRKRTSPRREAANKQTFLNPLQPLDAAVAKSLWPTIPSFCTNAFRAVSVATEDATPVRTSSSAADISSATPLAAPSYFGSEGQYGGVDSRFADDLPAASWNGPRGWLV